MERMTFILYVRNVIKTMKLKLRLPKNFKPQKIISLKDDFSDVQYWIYLKDGSNRNYNEASSSEIYDWVKELFPEYKLTKDFQFGLQITKSWALETALKVAIQQSEGLFGGQEFWKNIPEVKTFKDEKDNKQ
jgi:hypothetical protein